MRRRRCFGGAIGRNRLTPPQNECSVSMLHKRYPEKSSTNVSKTGFSTAAPLISTKVFRVVSRPSFLFSPVFIPRRYGSVFGPAFVLRQFNGFVV